MQHESLIELRQQLCEELPSPRDINWDDPRNDRARWTPAQRAKIFRRTLRSTGASWAGPIEGEGTTRPERPLTTRQKAAYGYMAGQGEVTGAQVCLHVYGPGHASNCGHSLLRGLVKRKLAERMPNGRYQLTAGTTPNADDAPRCLLCGFELNDDSECERCIAEMEQEDSPCPKNA